MDEIWHYGNTGLIVALATWLLKHTYAAGRKDQRITELSKRVDELTVAVSSRLDRIETLLMEGKGKR